MTPQERKQEIVKLVNDQQGCSVEALADSLDVSEATIRRDLKDLVENNLLKRTHGGAMPVINRRLPFDQRQVQHHERKIAIAQRALNEIYENQIVCMDAGATTAEIARQVPDEETFTTVTNSPLNAIELAPTDVNVQLMGGWCRSGNYANVGPWTEQRILEMNFDLLFLGADGVDTEGLTTQNPHQQQIKKLMIENSERVVLVTDHTKFAEQSFIRFAEISDLDAIITGDEVPNDIEEVCAEGNVELVDGIYED